MDEELFEDSLEAINEKDYERYIPKPYMNYFISVKYIPEKDELLKRQPSGVTATNYDRYGKKGLI